ncbi:hypothetical protein FO519_001591 [Halicephalobus sp. NKZ332]|nr:hypothetical protein FO519_001591 [Halicephalobus sp. NKZ332]
MTRLLCFRDQGRTVSGNMTSDKDYIIVQKAADPDAPLVLLFGWAGCRDRYLKKYSQIYEDKGCSIVRYTTPIKKIRGFRSFPAFAEDMYEKVFAEDDTSPIVFHVFSMNGCSLFVALWDLFGNVSNGEAIKSRVKGIIFDSCPANVMPWQAANAISFATLPPSKFSSVARNTYKVFLTGVISSHRALVYLQSFFDSSAYETTYAYFKLLTMKDIPQKQLYLYSKADDICSDFSIEEFAQTQKERGKEIQLQCWPDSLHVEHWRSYPEEYSSLCAKLVADAIQQKSPKNNNVEANDVKVMV